MQDSFSGRKTGIFTTRHVLFQIATGTLCFPEHWQLRHAQLSCNSMIATKQGIHPALTWKVFPETGTLCAPFCSTPMV